MEKKLPIIGFTVMQILCVFIAAYCALQHDIKQNTVLTILFLLLVWLCEYAKYKIIQHQYDKECEECKEWQKCNDLTEG